MTPVYDLLATLAKLNVKLWVEADRLRLSAPTGVLTPALQDQLRLQKDEILTLFAQRNGNGQPAAIQPAGREGQIPLSFAQQRLWFLAQLEGPNATYNLPSAFRLQGKLNRAALQRALDTLVARHEILRTTFAVEATVPFQLIAPTQGVPIAFSDLSAFSATAQPGEVQQWLDADAQLHFDLAQGPLLRVRLLKLNEEEHALSLTLHHIIADGWSAGILMQEFCTLYLNEQQQKKSGLPALPIQYADYAIWQQQQPQIVARQLDFWRTHLSGAPPLLELPLDRPRPSQQQFVGAQVAVTLDLDISRKVEQVARAHNATVHMTLLAAFALLLARYSGAKDIVIGTPVANRNRPELEPLIGFFVNTLALRFDLSGNPTFGELLQRVRQVTLDGYAHQDVPFEQVVEVLQPVRQLSHTPLFQTVFNLMTLPPTSFQLPGLTIAALSSETKTAKFDLALSVGQGAAGIEGAWEYNSELFAQATIERMARHWQHLLATAMADPAAPITSLSCFDEAELRQLLMACEGPQRALPAEPTIQTLFEAQAEKTPDALALCCENRQLSYRALDQRANQLAHWLQARGIQPGMYVGLCSNRSLEMLIGILGILKAGAAYVPLDPALPTERLCFMVEDAEIRLVLTEEKLVTIVEALQVPFGALDADWEEIAKQPMHKLPLARDIVREADAPIYLIYTSGSTGLPKGVIVPQRGVVNTILALVGAAGLGAGDRFLQFVPFSFDASALEFFGTLCSGATLVLHANPTQLSSLELLRFCEAAQISVVNFTVALWHQWVDDLHTQALHFPIHLRLFLTGGEKPARERLQRWACLGDHAMTYVCSYGPTEASITSTIFVTTNQAVRAAPPAAIPLGRPLPNTGIYLLDAHDQLAPLGVTGEICLAGVGLAIGYHHQEALTQEKFVTLSLPTLPPTYTPSGQPLVRLYRTGDLARRRPDGELEFVGRSDTQVKVRGFRVELGEIETMLKAHPLVEEALVIAGEFGPNDKRLIAYVQSDRLPDKAVKDYLKARLPAHMVPTAFVAIAQWPLTHNGKIDRKALPRPTFQDDETAYVAPRNEIEATLAAIWADVLGVSKVGVDHNFFELGGHSLLATQVVARIREQLQREVSLRLFFEQATIRTLAEQMIQQRVAAHRPPLVPVANAGDLPLSFAQQRLWLLQQLNPTSGFFNMPVALQLMGPLNVAALRASFAELVQRHATLRTIFPVVDGRPVQQIAPSLALAIPLLDLQGVAQTEQPALIHRLAAEEAARPFDLATGPLIRLTVLRMTAETHVLLLTMHHIVGDDWSNVLLMQEFATLYPAFVKQEPSPLPALPVQYADFAQWQRAWLQGETLAEQLAYWRTHLADAPPLLQLPLDHPRPAQQRFVGNTITMQLPDELVQKVRERSQQQHLTPHMILFAAFATLLARYSGQDDIVIGAPVANRPHVQVEPLVGCFLNTLALRVKLQNSPSFLELLHQVKRITTEGYEHQDVPFEQVLEALAHNPQLSHTPIFQVMFNYLQDHSAQLQLPDLQVSPLAVDNRTAKFDLTLTVNDSTKNTSVANDSTKSNHADELSLSWEYNSDIFEQPTIERMARHFAHLLDAALTDLSTPVAALPLLTAAERQQLLIDWNQTQVEIPAHFVMHQLFEQQVARQPDALAASCNGESISYRQLNEQANRWAHQLVAKGVKPDVVVGLLGERNLDFLSAILAIHKAGGAYLPIDPQTPASRLQTILQQCRTPLLLVSRQLQPLAAAAVAALPVEQQPQVLLIEALPNTTASADNLPVRSTPDHLAYVIYTSGSTGVPKGAMVEQRGLVNHLLAMQRNLQLTPSDVIAQSATQSYVISVWQFLAALVIGCRIEILTEATVMEPASLLCALAEQQVTVLQIVPSLLRVLLAEIKRSPSQLASLRWLIPTGEALPPALVRDWFAICPQIPLLNAYGASECSDDVAHDLISEPPTADTAHMPAGRPIGNVRMFVLDGQMQPVPIGVEGDLYVSGACVGRGYLNDAGRTATVFLRDPLSEHPQARLYKTGDKARWLANGKVDYLGRRDFQVKLRGFRIELGEIETMLGKHPAVAQAVVMARGDEQGNQQLVAYVVTTVGAAPTVQTLRTFVAEHLPEYMVPSAIVLLDQLPLNANGKLDRRALSTVAPLVPVDAQPYIAARNVVEARLIAILATILNIDATQLGVRHSFFDLGGHSLLAVQLLTQLRDSFGVELPLRNVFEHTTVEALANLVIETALAAVDDASLLTLIEQVEQMTDDVVRQEGTQRC